MPGAPAGGRGAPRASRQAAAAPRRRGRGAPGPGRRRRRGPPGSYAQASSARPWKKWALPIARSASPSSTSRGARRRPPHARRPRLPRRARRARTARRPRRRARPGRADAPSHRASRRSRRPTPGARSGCAATRTRERRSRGATRCRRRRRRWPRRAPRACRRSWRRARASSALRRGPPSPTPAALGELDVHRGVRGCGSRRLPVDAASCSRPNSRSVSSWRKRRDRPAATVTIDLSTSTREQAGDVARVDAVPGAHPLGAFEHRTHPANTESRSNRRCSTGVSSS